VKHRSVQFALREMRDLFASKRTWGGIFTISVILGVSGPFQTFEVFSPGPRLVYWSIVAILTFATGVFFSSLTLSLLENYRGAFFLRLLIVGIAAGIPVAFVVWLINVATFGWQVVENLPMSLAFYSVIIAMGITVLFILFDKKENEGKPAILLRLPHEMRGQLLSISVHDHYVEVSTSKGKHLLLMRLKDAMQETTGVEGMQIHRSHWVALEAIKSVKKNKGKTIILTIQGKELPVSRTYVPALKETGLLA